MMHRGDWPGIARAAAANIASYRTRSHPSNRFISNILWLASMVAKQRWRTLPGLKCGDCTKHAFIAVSDRVIERHLRGDIVAGIYPRRPPVS
jgi:hypothetical protein